MSISDSSRIVFSAKRSRGVQTVKYLREREWSHTLTGLTDRDDEVAELKAAAAGDETARETVCRRFARWATKIAVQYARRCPAADVNDVFQECMLGIMNAIDTYDSESGARFSTHLHFYLKRYAGNFVLWQQTELYVPLNNIPAMLRKISVLEQHGDCKLAAPAAAPATAKFDVEDYTVGTTISLSVADPDHVDAEDVSDSSIVPGDAVRIQAILESFLQRQLPRERDIFRLYYGIPHGEPLTLKEIGDSLGFSRERIRQIMEKIKGSLRREASFRKDVAELRDYIRVSVPGKSL